LLFCFSEADFLEESTSTETEDDNLGDSFLDLYDYYGYYGGGYGFGTSGDYGYYDYG